jgi:hypothetical protein
LSRVSIEEEPLAPDEANELSEDVTPFRPSDRVIRAAQERAETKIPQQDRLDQIRAAAIKAANLELEIKDLEDRLADLRSQLHRTLSDEVPALMTQAGCVSFTLKGQGNLPSKVFKVEPYYQASIPVSWDEGRRQRAFSALRDHNGGWMIKTTVVARFPQHRDREAREFVQAAKQAGIDLEVKQGVHQAQMTKWLRERHQSQGSLPDLELIGGAVGQRAVIKDGCKDE